MEKQSRPIIKSKQQPQQAKSKLIRYAAGAGVVFGAGYLAFTYFQNKAAQRGSADIADTTIAPTRVKSTNPNASNIVRQHRNQFPVKLGARGNLVVLIQKALLNIGGVAASIIRKTSIKRGKPDGVFGSGTVKALQAAGFSSVLSEKEFTRLIGTTNTSVSSNQALAMQLIKSANAKNLFAVLSGLQKIKDTTHYIAVSSFFKNTRILGTRVTSLVNALLSVAFRMNAAGKVKIRAEFSRMGLLQDQRGVWSIPNLGSFDTPGALKNYIQQQQRYKLAVTDHPTVLKSEDGSFITPPLNPNILIGYVMHSANGITKIIATNGEVVFAPENNLKIF